MPDDGAQALSLVHARDLARALVAPARTCSSAALERATGWPPETRLANGRRETARAYRGKRWL